jgi:GTP cyclohydrolase I
VTVRADPSSRRPDEPDLAAAAAHAKAMLAALAIDCDSEHTAGTPQRLVAALAELTAGRYADPDRHLATTFPAETDAPDMIMVPGIGFVSLCEHHLLPFTGTATVAYLPAPGARIVGLSKLARVVKEYAARPQTQERLGALITAAIGANLVTLGAACLIRSSHTCMTLRGTRAGGAEMITSHLAGEFRNNHRVRAEFLALAGPANAVAPAPIPH